MLFLPFSQVIAIYTKVMVNAAKTSLCKETQGKLCTRSCRWVVFILSKPVLVAHTFAHSGKSMQKRIYADRCGSSDGGKLPLADTPHQVKSNSKLTQRGGHSLPYI